MAPARKHRQNYQLSMCQSYDGRKCFKLRHSSAVRRVGAREPCVSSSPPAGGTRLGRRRNPEMVPLASGAQSSSGRKHASDVAQSGGGAAACEVRPESLHCQYLEP